MCVHDAGGTVTTKPVGNHPPAERGGLLYKAGRREVQKRMLPMGRR